MPSQWSYIVEKLSEKLCCVCLITSCGRLVTGDVHSFGRGLLLGSSQSRVTPAPAEIYSWWQHYHPTCFNRTAPIASWKTGLELCTMEGRMVGWNAWALQGISCRHVCPTLMPGVVETAHNSTKTAKTPLWMLEVLASRNVLLWIPPECLTDTGGYFDTLNVGASVLRDNTSLCKTGNWKSRFH